MADLLATAASRLASILKSSAGQAVTYARGDASVELTATIGRDFFEWQDETGFVHKLEMRDYLITAADLILNEAVVLPQIDDTISETVGGITYTYVVTPPGGELHYRWSDPHRTILRIHTKLQGTA